MPDLESSDLPELPERSFVTRFYTLMGSYLPYMDRETFEHRLNRGPLSMSLLYAMAALVSRVDAVDGDVDDDGDSNHGDWSRCRAVAAAAAAAAPAPKSPCIPRPPKAWCFPTSPRLAWTWCTRWCSLLTTNLPRRATRPCGPGPAWLSACAMTWAQQSPVRKGLRPGPLQTRLWQRRLSGPDRVAEHGPQDSHSRSRPGRSSLA